jgi:hypothetical protein
VYFCLAGKQQIHDQHILASMIYFDSDMYKSTNTVVYFDWKTVIYIYACGKCHTQFMLPMEKSVTKKDVILEYVITSLISYYLLFTCDRLSPLSHVAIKDLFLGPF